MEKSRILFNFSSKKEMNESALISKSDPALIMTHIITTKDPTYSH